MGIAEDITADWDAALAALAWQVECGVDEIIADLPLNRYEVAPAAALRDLVPILPMAAAPAPRASAQAAPLAPPMPKVDPVMVARDLAMAAKNLAELQAVVENFELCELKRGARNTVFADGNPRAKVMVLGEAPGREEDLAGKPFAGPAGAMLDRMFAAIGLSRDNPDAEKALYLANVVFWRPPAREPEAQELAMLQPLVARHIELADPDVIVVMGNAPLFALTGQRAIKRARGQWGSFAGKPVLPMLHPADLLRQPGDKREAWADLLALQAKLRG